MRHQNSFRAMFAEVIEGRQTFADSRVISDAKFASANFGRHVEVHAHQHAFPADIEITEGEFRHYLLLLLLMLLLLLNRVKSLVFTQELRSSRKSLQHSHEHIHDSDEPFLGRKDLLSSDKLSHRKHIEACRALQR